MRAKKAEVNKKLYGVISTKKEIHVEFGHTDI